MRIFRFDPLAVNPLDIARRDNSEFFVEKIIQHEGDFRKVLTLTFKVRWLHYTDEYDTWEPWKNLRHAAPLHEYLRSIGKAKLIPTSKLDSNSSWTLCSHHQYHLMIPTSFSLSSWSRKFLGWFSQYKSDITDGCSVAPTTHHIACLDKLDPPTLPPFHDFSFFISFEFKIVCVFVCIS